MYKRIALAAALAVFSLGACDSFTLSYTHGEQPPAPPAPQPLPSTANPASGVVQTDPVATQSSVIKSLTDITDKQKEQHEQVMQGWCPKWNPPKLPPIPAAPEQQLAQLKPSDTEAIAALTRQHIVDMHNWARNAQALYTRSYQGYLASCAQAKKAVAATTPNM